MDLDSQEGDLETKSSKEESEAIKLLVSLPSIAVPVSNPLEVLASLITSNACWLLHSRGVKKPNVHLLGTLEVYRVKQTQFSRAKIKAGDRKANESKISCIARLINIKNGTAVPIH